MSQHPETTTPDTDAQSGLSKGEKGFFLLALVLVLALVGGIVLFGALGATMVMVALVPVIYVTLVSIAWGA